MESTLIAPQKGKVKTSASAVSRPLVLLLGSVIHYSTCLSFAYLHSIWNGLTVVTGIIKQLFKTPSLSSMVSRSLALAIPN